MTGWNEVVLGDVVTLETQRHDASDKPFVGLEHIESGTGRLLRGTGQVQAEGGTFAFGPEHLLYGRLRPYLNKVHLPSFEGHCSTEIYPIRPQAAVDRRYLFYWLTKQSTVDAIMATCTGARMPRANLNELLKLRLPLPSLAEQQRIIATLDEAFEAIALAVAHTEANLSSVTALERSCLEAELLPATTAKRTVPLERLCAAGRPITYGVVKLGEPVNNGIPCLRTSNVRWLKIEQQGLKLIDPDLSLEYRRTILQGGEVLVNVRGTLGGVAVVPLEMAGWNISREVAIVPSDVTQINSEFLAFWIASQDSQEWLYARTTGAAYVGINIADLRQLPVPILPLAQQEALVGRVHRVMHEQADLMLNYNVKLSLLVELKQSLLARAFSGELAAAAAPVADDDNFATPQQAANILALMHWQHECANRGRYFGHVMGQKTLDLVERVGRVELGRAPYKDAAGPNDRAHMAAAERWAKQQGFFEFVERSGGGYDFRKLSNHSVMLTTAKTMLKPVEAQLARVTDILVGKDKIEAEVFDTLLAAWNNLVADGAGTSDAAIIYEARENWHADKLAIPVSKFQSAIQEIRRRGLVPDGTAKVVRHRQGSLL